MDSGININANIFNISTIDLAVANHASNDISILFNNDMADFVNQTTYQIISTPCYLITSDFNKDGKLDIAVTNQISYGGFISIFIGLGHGIFSDRIDYTVGRNPSGISVGDFNLDDNLDLAVTNYEGCDISILFGDGDNSYNNRLDIKVGQKPVGITSGDFNKDGKLDIAVANSADNDTTVLYGDGQGDFIKRTDYIVGNYPFYIINGDFNKDDYLDLAITNSRDDSISILYGNEFGEFENNIDFSCGSNPLDMVSNDYNSDGFLDLVVTNIKINCFTIIFNDRKGGFVNGMSYEVGKSPYGISSEDFNLDGHLDIAVANHDDNSISILFGNSKGEFNSRRDFSVGNGPWGLVAGDFDSNSPPEEPMITGPISGKIECEYKFNFSTTDPDGDEVFYWILWFEGCPGVSWIGPYDSGEIISKSYTYNEEGNYTISVKSRDSYGGESDWSTLKVIITKKKSYTFNPNILFWLFERFPFLESYFDN
jgi:hypothetical protein